MTDTDRLDKCVSRLARCSRAEAQQYIENGWVSVDGEVVEEPQAPIATEHVELAPDARLGVAEPATMLLHKPAGLAWSEAAALISPDTQVEQDPTRARQLKRHFQRLTAQMPMDTEASGLIVVTQDGRVKRRLSEDYVGIEQEFVVEIDGEILPYGLARLASGLRYQSRTLPPCKVSWQNEIRLRFAIKNVQPGQLEHMCHEVGLRTVAIKRLRIGRISLGKMPVGEWRYLPTDGRF